jgi:hypothetical protein
MKSLEKAVKEVLDKWVMEDEVPEATEAMLLAIKDLVGATQEKLWNDLQNERTIRKSLEARLEWLGQFVALRESDNGASSTERPTGTTG